MRTPAPLPPTPPPHHPPDPTTHLLEINLISAQALKPPSTNLRRKLQTYAVAYVEPSLKLRTRIDRLGDSNPTWNDKFIFRVSDHFLSGPTSAVSVDIFSVGVLKDTLLGSVRFLLSNILSPATSTAGVKVGVPAFTAVQVRRPSGRVQGVLNVGVMVIDGEGIGSLSSIAGIGYRDLMGEGGGKGGSRMRRGHRRGLSEWSSGSEVSWGGDSVDFSDGTESTGSNSSSTTSSVGVLKEVNGRREIGGEGGGEGGGNGNGILCGLAFPRKCFSDQDIKRFAAFDLSPAAQI